MCPLQVVVELESMSQKHRSVLLHKMFFRCTDCKIQILMIIIDLCILFKYHITQNIPIVSSITFYTLHFYFSLKALTVIRSLHPMG